MNDTGNYPRDFFMSRMTLTRRMTSRMTAAMSTPNRILYAIGMPAFTGAGAGSVTAGVSSWTGAGVSTTGAGSSAAGAASFTNANGMMILVCPGQYGYEAARPT